MTGREPDIQRDRVAIDIRGRCLCGKVQFFASSTPMHQFYCHCRSCQTAHSAPFVAGAQFPVSEVRVIGDTRIVRVTSHPEATPRVTCSDCGTRVMNMSPRVRTLFPALCDRADWFRPTMHIQWRDRVLDISDDLPKYLDFPAVFGGTDERVE